MTTKLHAPIAVAALLGVARLLLAPAPAAASAPRPPAAPAAVLADAPPGTVLRDDDDARVQIVPRTPHASRQPIDHGGPIVTRETVHLLFLGSGWSDAAQRALEDRVAGALFARHRGGQQLEDPVDPAGHQSISDLEIQHRLAALLGDDRSGELARPGAVFVVFVAPGLESTLGSHSSARDYAAYHNFLHAASGAVRYVVVPFDPDFAAWTAAARQSLVQTLINPEGTGWY